MQVLYCLQFKDHPNWRLWEPKNIQCKKAEKE